MVNHLQDLILAGLQGMPPQSYLEGGWALVQCSHSAVGILKLIQLIMSLGLLVKRFVLSSFHSYKKYLA